MSADSMAGAILRAICDLAPEFWCKTLASADSWCLCGREIEREKLEQVLEAARLALSPMNTVSRRNLWDGLNTPHKPSWLKPTLPFNGNSPRRPTASESM